jgi:hypothetical protein
MTTITIHCYVGCSENPQNTRFKDSMISVIKLFGHRIKCEVLCNNFIREDMSWTEAKLVDWLLCADIHLIICHPHQGLRFWTPLELQKQLQRLENHIGFPSGLQLQCPIFRQDKLAYIYPAYAVTNKTLRVYLQDSYDYMLERDRIER